MLERTVFAGFSALLLLVGVASAPEEEIQANPNRVPAGMLRNGVLTVRLEARAGVWHPEADGGPGLVVQALAEEGHAAQNPGPLIRVPEGTEIRVTVRNSISDATLVVHGLHTRPSDFDDTLQVAPGAAREVRFAAGTPGTYFYWATTGRAAFNKRTHLDSQLSGALIVDPEGSRAAPAERVFVIGAWVEGADTVVLEPQGVRARAAGHHNRGESRPCGDFRTLARRRARQLL